MISNFTTDEYRWLSNFFPCQITYNNITFASVEHAYMSAKSDNIQWKIFCRDEPNPGTVKQSSKNINLLDNWNEIRTNVMKTCINIKFNQEPFRTQLINTGTEYIQEGNWWHDTFWGVDLNADPPVGKNMLGKIIMEARSNLVSLEIL